MLSQRLVRQASTRSSLKNRSPCPPSSLVFGLWCQDSSPSHDADTKDDVGTVHSNTRSVRKLSPLCSPSLRSALTVESPVRVHRCLPNDRPLAERHKPFPTFAASSPQLSAALGFSVSSYLSDALTDKCHLQGNMNSGSPFVSSPHGHPGFTPSKLGGGRTSLSVSCNFYVCIPCSDCELCGDRTMVVTKRHRSHRKSRYSHTFGTAVR